MRTIDAPSVSISHNPYQDVIPRHLAAAALSGNPYHTPSSSQAQNLLSIDQALAMEERDLLSRLERVRQLRQVSAL